MEDAWPEDEWPNSDDESEPQIGNYRKNCDNTLTDQIGTNDLLSPTKDHHNVLHKYFGHTSFRPMQWQIIHSVMEEKKDNCVIMATGYGKSLCYQYPAIYKKGLCIVISPLISLMEDQVQSLEIANIPACLLGTAQMNKSEVMQNILEGVYRLVYMTPEFALADFGTQFLKKLDTSVNITLLAIDEAHCVSQWGHDFRPSYRGLYKIRETLKSVPVLAVTATATTDVRDDIVKSLRLKSPQLLCTGFDRPNLFFKVEKKSRDAYSDIKKVLSNQNKIFNITTGSTIIYCLTRKATEEIVEVLNSKGIQCEAYHAGLSVSIRKNVHEQFVRDDIKVIVATVAFGMGIDKPNVRCVIHYGTSSNMEGYYQEAGRAGRDGNPSLCVLYHSPADFITHSYLRDKSHMSADTKAHKENLNSIMKQYVSSRECRRFLIMSYFDQKITAPTSFNSNCCDNCTNKLHSPHDSMRYEGINAEGLYDFSEDAEIFLKALKLFLPKEFGLGMIISQLKGSKSKKMYPSYLKLESHGSGSSKSEDWWKQIAIILEQQNLINKVSRNFGANNFPIIALKTSGERWLDDKKNNRAKSVLAIPTQDMMPFLKIKSRIENTSSAINQSIVSQSATTLTRDQLNEHQQGLLDVLFEIRFKLAKEQSIMPHVIASDIALHQMAKIQPVSLKRMIAEKFDGMSEMKIEKFGSPLLKKILEYVNAHPAPILPIEEILVSHPLPPSTCANLNNAINSTQRISLDMFNEGESPSVIASKRKLAESTIWNHLGSALRTTYSLDVSRLITAPKLNCIIKIIEVNNDVSKLNPIKNLCPPVITYEEIKIAIAFWEVKNHLKSLNVSYSDKYGLTGEGKASTYTSITITPEKDDASLLENVDTNTSEKSIPETGENSTNSKQIPASPSSDDDLWNEDDLFEENIDEIDKIMMNANNSKDSKPTDLSPSTEKSEISFVEQNASQTNDTMSKLDNKYINPVDDSATSKRSLNNHNTVSDNNSNPAKRKLPEWISNVTEAKNVMRAKLSKNSLFN